MQWQTVEESKHNADRRGVLVDDTSPEIVEVIHQRIALHLLLPGGIPSIKCLLVMAPKVLIPKTENPAASGS